MNLKDNFQNTYNILSTNKTRSFLTMLGIVIGIMAVIIVMAVGAGAQSLILNQVKSMGTNLIGVMPGYAEDKGPPASAMGVVITTLKYDDVEAIKKRGCSCIESLSAYVSGNDVLNLNNVLVNTTFSGVSASYLEVEDTALAQGRFFTADEEKSLARVVILGDEVREKLFGDEDSLGKKIRIKKTSFMVIGTMKKRGVSMFQNQDDQVFVPVTTAQKLLLGIDHISLIRIKVNSAENIEKAVTSVRQVLREQHNIGINDREDFSARSMAQGIEALTNITNALKFFLVAISALALVVGGFGIMNIMLASVQERTREIGLRKALGAKANNIVLQFLIETMVITFFAGMIGIILGISIAIVVAKIAQFLGYQWDLLISPFSVLLGCVVSISIGLIFGIIPAKRASKLNAIEALRYE